MPDYYHPLFRDLPDRMQAEVGLMLEFTTAVLVVTSQGELAWIEEIRSVASGRPFRLAIVYPTAFPHIAPRVFVLKPDVTGAPHRLADGALCIFGDHVHGSGARTSALSCRNRAIAWFLAFEVWAQTGEWLRRT